MRVYRVGKAPVQFLLHIINGYVYELEIFNADSSEIDKEGLLENADIQIIVNEKIS